MKFQALIPTLLILALARPALRAQSPEAPPAPSSQSAEAPPAASSETAEAPKTQPGSDVRIVRLSEIKGKAEMDRNTGNGYEAAFNNLPVVQGAKLRTTAQGVAEVEFEDNSTLRLTPSTEVDFKTLRRDPSGATLSTIHVLKGMVYLSLTNKKSVNQVTLEFATDKLAVAPGSHIQLSVSDPATRLSVLDGSVDATGSFGTIAVAKKKSLVFDPADHAAPTLVAGIEKTPFDDWDKQAVDYHKRYANASAFGSSSPGFGISDLNYYGSFADLPGCGSVWRPYFASTAWDPFANGIWAWYPNAGYSWVSPYPWGWAPFHYGSWQQCGNGAWGWNPNGQWVGLRNSGIYRNPVHGPTHGRPPLPPTPGRPTLVPVNITPLVASRLTNSENFVFSKDSAGLGVPRQGFGNLNRVSSGVAQHGVAVVPVYSTPAQVHSGAAFNPTNPVHAGGNTTTAHSAGNWSGNASSGGSAGVAHTSTSAPSAPVASVPSHR